MADAHAEIGVIQQAFKEGVTKDANMTITVFGDKVCDYCRGDIPAAAEKSGLKSLTVIEVSTGKILLWERGATKFTEATKK